MKGAKDHGRWSNLDHARYVEAQRKQRSDKGESGVPGRDFSREQRVKPKRKRK